jgi:formylglycine-generating enzyme required for sulfatase activity
MLLRFLPFSTLLIALVANASDADRRFYRVVGQPGTDVLSVTRDGFLSWSSATAEGSFLVETTEDLHSWQPWARGFLTGATTRLKVYDPSTPAGMSFVPGGYFTMGDDEAATLGNIEHRVSLSPFYISRSEITVDQARILLQWALDHGKVGITGGGTVMNLQGNRQILGEVNTVKTLLLFNGTSFSVRPPLVAQPKDTGWNSRHPLTAVTWYGAVAYCNYLSEMQGKEPCYNLADWSCDFTKSGFRLPTESEWEKAARGGFERRRFPWGDTISHSQANYRSSTANGYDVSTTRDFHPIYDLNRPIRTAPVGSFEPNGYGLYDVAGNVFEWCWDAAGRYTGQALTNPTGPEIPHPTGHSLLKGGSLVTSAEGILLASRYIAAPRDSTHSDIGFRFVVRPPSE